MSCSSGPDGSVGQWSRSGPLAIEYRPADRVAQPLVIQHKIANRQRQPLTLPAALAPTSTIALALRSSSPRCLDRIGGGTEFVGCNVGDAAAWPAACAACLAAPD